MPFTDHYESLPSFEKLLKQLTDVERWEMLEDSLSPLDPILEEFKSRRWCSDRLPGDSGFEVLPILTLYIIYQTRLLIESIQQASSTDSEANLYLLVPLYLWPANQLWVQGNTTAISRPSQQKAPTWFSNPQSAACLDELDLPHPTDLAAALLTTMQASTNLSRRIAEARSQLYAWLCQSLGVEVVSEQPAVPKTSQGKPAKLTIESLPQALQPIARSTITGPLLQDYFSQLNVQQTYLTLLHRHQSQPTIIAIANQIIADRLDAITPDQTQQAAASHLLCRLAAWTSGDAPALTYQNLETRWKNISDAAVDGLLRILFDAGLVITDEHQRIRIAAPFIRDAALFRTSSVRSQPGTLPDIGFSQSTWLLWALAHRIEQDPSQDVGDLIWKCGLPLAGFQSRAWGQAAMLLGILSPERLTKPYGQGIMQIVVHLIERHAWGRSWAQWARQAGLPEQIANAQTRGGCISTLRIFQAYLDGLDLYLKATEYDTGPDHILAIALGRKVTSRDNPWVRIHAFSALRRADADLVVDVKLAPGFYHSKKLVSAVYSFAQRTESPDMQLAACEVLAAWGHQPTQQILESKYQNLDEYGHRARILRSALLGEEGYNDWV